MAEYQVTVTRLDGAGPAERTILFSRIVDAPPNFAALGAVCDAAKPKRVRKPKVAP